MTLAITAVACTMPSIAAQNIPALSGSEVSTLSLENDLPTKNTDYDPVAESSFSTQSDTRASAYNVPISMYDATASLNDSKPSAYNAPVVNHTVGKQYMCKSGQEINVLTEGVDHIKLNVDGQELVLHKMHYSSWRTFGVFYRPKQGEADKAEYNTESGLNGAGTVWKQYKHRGTLKFYDVNGQLTSSDCEAVR